MSAARLVNGVAGAALDAGDRGLAYGDGVFETLLVAAGAPVWWDAHLQRLERGCAALGIAAPARGVLQEEAERVLRGADRAVLKLIVTRGAAARGYAPGTGEPTRIVSRHPFAPTASALLREGAPVRWCALRLGRQPRLAGHKHLNRLEQVLARAEWNDDSIVEGLLRDDRGAVVGATAANLFALVDGELRTPPVEDAGVAGVARAWVLAHSQARIAPLGAADVERAGELFLTSSLRGILPVARLDGRHWSPGPMTRTLQDALWREVPALRPDCDA